MADNVIEHPTGFQVNDLRTGEVIQIVYTLDETTKLADNITFVVCHDAQIVCPPLTDNKRKLVQLSFPI